MSWKNQVIQWKKVNLIQNEIELIGCEATLLNPLSFYRNLLNVYAIFSVEDLNFHQKRSPT